MQMFFWNTERTTTPQAREQAMAQGHRLTALRTRLQLPERQAAAALQMLEPDFSGLQQGLLTMPVEQWDFARKALVDHVAKMSGRTMSIEGPSGTVVVRLFRWTELDDERERVAAKNKSYGWTIYSDERMVRVVGATDPELPAYPTENGLIEPAFADAVARAHAALLLRMRPGEQADAASAPLPLR